MSASIDFKSANTHRLNLALKVFLNLNFPLSAVGVGKLSKLNLVPWWYCPKPIKERNAKQKINRCFIKQKKGTKLFPFSPN